MATQQSQRNLPDIWSDDEQMSVMFAHFRQSRDLNPRSWDNKMKFWTNMILEECARCGDVVADVGTFPSRFVRDGRSPKCLGRVFNEMLKNGDIVPLDEFVKEANLNMLTWALDRLVVNPVKWGWQSFLAGEQPEEINEGRYIVWSVIKSLSTLVEQNHQATVKNPVIDHIVEVCDLRKQNECTVKDEETMQLVLMHLRKLGRVQLIYALQTGNDKVRAVKFAHKDLPTVQAVNEFDRKVLKLKQTESELEEELDKNYVEMEKALAEAKRYVREGQKANARASLRVKKKCEEQIQKRAQALANVQDILSKIRDSHADRMIVEAYEAGAEALRASNKAAPTTSTVDNIMTELEELFEEEGELKASLNAGPGGEQDVSMAELEAELAQITGDGDTDEQDDKDKVPTLPSVPKFDPSPVEEPLDCDLSDIEDDVHTGSSLPSVPAFEPKSRDHRPAMAETT